MYYFLTVGSIAFIVVMILWRLVSTRRNLPCPSWLGWLVELENPLAKNHRADSIIEYINLQEGMRVLDAGCGPGRLTIPLAKKIGLEGEVVALDMQAGMLNRVRKKAAVEGLANIRLINAGLEDAGLDEDYFDRVTLVAVLGEIPSQSCAIKEIFAALKPGGILSISEIIFDPHYQSRKTVRRLALELGFRECGYFGSFRAYTINFEKPV